MKIRTRNMLACGVEFTDHQRDRREPLPKTDKAW